MEIYLPIAEISVDVFYLIFVGIIAGIVGGFFGVGGSFLGIPILTSYGIDSAVLIASYTHQMITTSFMSLPEDLQQKKINFKLVLLTFIGGSLGAILGSFLFKYFNMKGQIEFVVAFIYVFVLGGISFFMIKESFVSILKKYFPDSSFTLKIISLSKERKENFIMKFINTLPKQIIVSDSKSISIYAIFFFGLCAGLLVALAGISSGFIMIPIMIYIYKMQTRMAIATSNIHGGFLVVLSSILQAVYSHTVDLILSIFLAFSTAVGMKIARRFAHKIPGEELRISMAIIMLILITRIILNIVFEPSVLINVSVVH